MFAKKAIHKKNNAFGQTSSDKPSITSMNMKRYCLLILFIVALTCLCTQHIKAQTFYICQGKNTVTTSELSFLAGSFEPTAIDSITFTPPAGQRFVGGDVSLLAKYENQGAQYKDKDG